ncbi:MAG: hypothetical protein RBR15_03145 [Sphaerochaeta sp.]|nr:hypothetical protein [Sphaerochaeta sp.]MDY0287805.1 hypothetical protein [Sphaerochaeta sp.]
MKKITAILLILVLAGFGLFAAVDNSKEAATIKVKTVVADFSAFGVSSLAVGDDAFKTIAAFQGAVSSNVDTAIAMLSLNDFVLVGHLSGINNTTAPVALGLSISDLESGTSNKVALTLSTYAQTIDASKDSKFGTLKNIPISIKEATVGAAALAPAGTYNATITISLKTN